MEGFKVVLPSDLHGNALDVSGRRFGKLTALCPTNVRRYGNSIVWVAVCDCGNVFYVRSQDLVSGNTASCGCLVGEANRARSPYKHLKTRNSKERKEALSWRNMIRRCTVPGCVGWENYGGRGISVCDRWVNGEKDLTGWDCFFEDMGPCPERHELDRKDPDGDYTPENCWWAPAWFQRVNTRNTHRLLHNMYEKGWSAKRVLEAMGVEV